ncbi:4'-phosphopantetheinyl transferase superfamily protein [Streptomyces sp. ISL-94]|uniref:4'-phosphopantetheinyl transferase family protein n=1 Tax=Streptomyces sp. ISL-94 TaxID=2819190 RepID=UPI001BE63DBB|nr:4'-phosphopantetheinyl transferase superfamily protein [Streptomyces sp. ISL-94]MBT2479888.1 4'-phosphopantetheinyl transferase superfamily protein [Streptomyces sp. ISL-94]
MALTRPAAEALEAPLYVPGPEGPWDEVGDRLDDAGRAVVCTTWGQWLTAVLLDPALRPLLGEDWPRFRQTPAAAGRMRFAVSRFVVKYTAATALDVPVDTLDLGYGPGGRPVLRGQGSGVEVSLAHTGELIVVGVSRTGPIGVDAEPVDRDISVGLLRGHVCTAQEGAVLDALPEDERRARLLWLWTLKEAYTKALGHGGRRRFSTFGFGLDGGGRVVLTEAADAQAAEPVAGEWSFATHLVQDRYVVSEAHRPRP